MKLNPSIAPGRRDGELQAAERALVAQQDANGIFKELLSFARSGGGGADLHEVERELFVQLLGLGHALLKLVVAKRGTGKVPGGVATTPDGNSLPYHAIKSRSYLSVFGEIDIPRAYYWTKGEPGWFPLDAELNLPPQRYSYLLQEWGLLFGVEGAFERVTERLEMLLRVKFWSQGVQHVAHDAALDVQTFYEEKSPPSPNEEGEILVATIDGKGVRMRRGEPKRRKLRLAPGEKPDKKREAVVAAAYTIDRYIRTPDEVLREIDDDGCIVEPERSARPRPRPQNKRLRATMQGKDAAFEELRRQLDERDPVGDKERVALTDGAEPLQERVPEYLAGPSGITLILDIMHALGYLWTVSYVFHADGTPDASRWVMNKLRLLLEGKLGYVIGSLRSRLGKKKGLNKSKRKALTKAINYLHRNRRFMAYDDYLAKGYPIGSGVVEGACKHLVKDRMECTGMRWSLDGAEAMLELRAVELNGDWAAFWTCRVDKQRERLYGKAA